MILIIEKGSIVFQLDGNDTLAILFSIENTDWFMLLFFRKLLLKRKWEIIFNIQFFFTIKISIIILVTGIYFSIYSIKGHVLLKDE